MWLGIADDMGGPQPSPLWVKIAMTITAFLSLYAFGWAVGPSWRWHLVFSWIWLLVLASLALVWFHLPTA